MILQSSSENLDCHCKILKKYKLKVDTSYISLIRHVLQSIDATNPEKSH